MNTDRASFNWRCRYPFFALLETHPKAAALRLLPQRFCGPDSKKGAHRALMQVIDCISLLGAGEANRTPDPNLGKVMLYP